MKQSAVSLDQNVLGFKKRTRAPHRRKKDSKAASDAYEKNLLRTGGRSGIQERRGLKGHEKQNKCTEGAIGRKGRVESP